MRQSPEPGGGHGSAHRPSTDRDHPAPLDLDLVTIGEAMVLLVADGALPLTTADRYSRSVAGAEATVAVGGRRLGLATGWISRVGADPFGEVVLRTMRAEGVTLSVATDDSRPTGVLIRDSPLSGAITVQYHRAGSAATALSEVDVRVELVRAARLLHLTGITAMLSDSAAGAVDAALGLARAAGKCISFDPNVRVRLAPSDRWSARIAPLAAASDIVLSGADELPVVTGVGSEPDAVASLLDAGVSVVVVKDGARGSRAYTEDGMVSAPAQPVHAVDAVGAGDAFAAGFLARVLRDHPGLAGRQRMGLPALHRALTTGNAVAAAAVGVVGDLAGLPFGVDLDDLVRTGSGHVSR